MGYFNPIRLISCHEEVSLHHFQHEHQGGRDHRSSQVPSRWPTTEFNTTTDNLEIRHVQVAFLHKPEKFTQRFSKLKNSSDLLHAAEYSTTADIPRPSGTQTLFTQDLDQTLTCCVKMVKQNSYAQEVKE
jgi:hypothetical protein